MCVADFSQNSLPLYPGSEDVGQTNPHHSDLSGRSSLPSIKNLDLDPISLGQFVTSYCLPRAPPGSREGAPPASRTASLCNLLIAREPKPPTFMLWPEEAIQEEARVSHPTKSRFLFLYLLYLLPSSVQHNFLVKFKIFVVVVAPHSLFVTQAGIKPLLLALTVQS